MVVGRIMAVLVGLVLVLGAGASDAQRQRGDVARERHGIDRRSPRMEHMRERRERWDQATPEERERMRERQERFEDATPEERREFRERHLERMRRFGNHAPGGPDAPWRQLSREDRETIRGQIESLPAAERHELRGKLRRFHSLPEDERAKLQRRFDQLQGLEPGEQAEIQNNAQRFQGMDSDTKDRLRETMRRFRELPPDKQNEWLDRALEETPDSTH